MSTLFRYIVRELLRSCLVALLALTALFTFFDVIAELRDVDSSYTSGLAMLVVALRTPSRLYELFHVAVLVGGLFAWNRLALSSEFSVIRTSGVSARRMLGWMLAIGLLLGATGMLLGEYVAPYSERIAQQFKLKATSGVVAQKFQTGLWAKDGRTFINIRELLPDASLVDVRLYDFDAEFRLSHIRRAESADWQSGRWVLRKVTDSLVDEHGLVTRQLPDQAWTSAVTPDLLAVLMVAPQHMPIHTLQAYVQHLETNHQDAGRYRAALWGKLVYPLAAPVMLLMALAFAYHPPRSGGAGGRLLLGVMLGLGFYLLSRLIGQIAQLQSLPAPAAAALPVVLFSLAALTAVWWQERR
jgi:lipopolysaccharide export system permease protein